MSHLSYYLKKRSLEKKNVEVKWRKMPPILSGNESACTWIIRREILLVVLNTQLKSLTQRFLLLDALVLWHYNTTNVHLGLMHLCCSRIPTGFGAAFAAIQRKPSLGNALRSSSKHFLSWITVPKKIKFSKPLKTRQNVKIWEEISK